MMTQKVIVRNGHGSSFDYDVRGGERVEKTSDGAAGSLEREQQEEASDLVGGKAGGKDMVDEGLRGGIFFKHGLHLLL